MLFNFTVISIEVFTTVIFENKMSHGGWRLSEEAYCRRAYLYVSGRDKARLKTASQDLNRIQSEFRTGMKIGLGTLRMSACIVGQGHRQSILLLEQILTLFLYYI